MNHSATMPVTTATTADAVPASVLAGVEGHPAGAPADTDHAHMSPETTATTAAKRRSDHRGFPDQDMIAALIETGRLRQVPSTEIAERIVELIEDSKWALRPDHPTRVAIMRLLRRTGALSPARAAEELDGVTLGAAAYHFRALARRGLIEICDEIQRRGATEHIYRCTP